MSRRPAASFLPTTAVLEMTYRCNHACLFCSCPWERRDGDFDRREEMPAEKWRSVVSMLCGLGVSSIAFTGGEPLLKEGLADIVRHAAGCVTERIETVDGHLVSKSVPPALYLLSNGRLVDDTVLDLCSAHDVTLSMSLPGLSTYREHTGFDTADHVLEYFGKARERGIRTVANITVTARNLFELKRTIAAALLAGAGQVLLNRFLPGGRGLENAEALSLRPGDVRSILDTAEEVLTKAGRFGTLGTEIPVCLADPSAYSSIRAGTHCSAARQFFVIGPSGFVRVCNHSEVRLAHIDDYPTLKLDPYWTTFTQKRFMPPECGGCDRRFDCDAGCREAAHITGGSVDSPDPLLDGCSVPWSP